MINMILDIIDSMIILILPIFAIILLLLHIKNTVGDIVKGRDRNGYRQLKGLFCVLFTFAITFTTVIMLIFNTYWVAVALKEIEAIYVVRKLIFICIEFVWSMIGVGLIIGTWKLIYYTNYDLINKFKNNWKKIREGKRYGRYEDTN